MPQSLLLTGFFFGLVLVGLVLVFTARGWRHYSVTVATFGTGTDARGAVSRYADDPTVLSAAFLLATLVFAASSLAFVGGGGASEGTASDAGVVLVAATAVVAVGYVFYGTYRAARSWGLMRSQAALAGSWVLGLLFVVVVVGRLLGLY